MTCVRLLRLSIRLSALNDLAYRTHFVVQVFESLLDLIAALGGLALVYAHTATLGGWRPAELLAVLGVFFLMSGTINLVMQPSMQRLMEDVWLGTLDFILTKPEDAQLLVSVQEVQLWKLVDVALGLALLGVAVLQLGARLGVGQAGAFIIALLAGGAIVYSFLLVLATCSFWTIRAPNILAIFQSMYEAGRWPISIYPTWLRATLTVVVPVGFAVTVPAGALVGHQGWQGIVGAVALAGALIAASRWFWTRGLRHYVGASA